MQEFYFIVTFAIPPGSEAEFRQQFDAISERMRTAGTGGSGALYEVASSLEAHLSQVPGIGAALSNRPDGRASFRFVLVARWESLAHYEAVLRTTSNDMRITFPAYPAYYRLAAEYRGTANTVAATGFTFISAFEVATEQAEDFIPQWRAIIERLHLAEGFLSARLFAVDEALEEALLQTPRIAAALQQRENGNARFRFVWVSQWASLEQYESAVRTFGRGNPLPFPSHPAFYREVKN